MIIIDQQLQLDEVTMNVTQIYEDIDNLAIDRLHNEIEMSPNVVYGAGDQKPSETKMKNQVYSGGSRRVDWLHIVYMNRH